VKRPRTYRKAVPLSFEEALQVAVAALQAYFIEQPLFANSCTANMSKAALDALRDPRHATLGNRERADDPTLPSSGEKAIVIELQSETQISRSEQEQFPFGTVPNAEIEEQSRNVARLKELLDFTQESHGHTGRS
jgi:hypothetical protein